MASSIRSESDLYDVPLDYDHQEPDYDDDDDEDYPNHPKTGTINKSISTGRSILKPSKKGSVNKSISSGRSSPQPDYGDDDEEEDEEEEEEEEEEKEESTTGESETSSGSEISGDEAAEKSLLRGTKKKDTYSMSSWDVFSQVPWLSDHEQNEIFYAKCRKVFKIFTYIFLFTGIFVTAFLSKGALLMAVSNLRPPPARATTTATQPAGSNVTDFYQYHTLECLNFTDTYNVSIRFLNLTMSETVVDNRTMCVAVPVGYSKQVDCLELPVQSGHVIANTTMQYPASKCDSLRLYWVWSLFLMICMPYALVIVRSFWTIMFKNKNSPRMAPLAWALATETLHSAGLSFFLFYILPAMENAFHSLMLITGVAILPSLLLVIARPPDQSKSGMIPLILNVMALVVQIMVSILFTWYSISKSDDPVLRYATIPTMVCISVRWWENFVDKGTLLSIKLGRLSAQIRQARTKIQLIANFVKILVTFFVLIIAVRFQMDKIDPYHTEDWTIVFNIPASRCRNIHVHPSNTNSNTTEGVWTIGLDQLPDLGSSWVFVWMINGASSLACYFFACIAAKIRIQRVASSLPLLLSTPVMAAFILGGCQLWNEQPCSLVSGAFNGHFFYKCYHADELGTVWKTQMWYLLPVFWLSLMWTMRHVWFPKSERLAKTDKIFVFPMFDGVLINESLFLNRNRNDEPKPSSRKDGGTIQKTAEASVLAARSELNSTSVINCEEGKMKLDDDDEGEGNLDESAEPMLRKDTTPYIYVCATMWHENRGEMVSMLKSIFRMDSDQAARKNAQTHFGIVDPDYYEFEAHIFFDNAMTNHDESELEYKVNDYVALLVSVLGEAASGVHDTLKRVDPPIKIPTPYGGRLEWTLPGENKLYVHLKDSAKIRHKKRWSQVMYMYYFLGFKLWLEDINVRRKQIRAENTFLLALDGDVDFEPLALILLTDLMKRSEKVGAVCGRIHPIGTGPMVWYQEFEYALGHWMQKAAEHVIGCVLCSPGCFSLFRGSVLMDENIMNKYTTLAVGPRDHIQYDQGEDRWLCTLILQQGYRVEYCAASDSYTNAPEGFNEFFNQRRRWMPSTMANIVDLLQSWKHTTTVNENISFIYIFYQGALLIASLFSPGIIFMMIVGAMYESMKNWTDALNLWTSAVINLIPMIIFIILCFKASSEIQLWFAWFLTGIYILVQMLVLVGTMVTMAENYVCHPTTVFFFGVAGAFFLAACLHPQEFHCLLKGFVYYFSIPTMYMILMIYAILNLHIVSWGTREVKQTPTEKQAEEAKKDAAETKRKMEEAKKKGVLFDVMNTVKSRNPKKDCKCGSLCNIICCSKPDQVKEKEEDLALLRIQLEKMEKSVTDISAYLDDNVKRQKSQVVKRSVTFENLSPENPDFDDHHQEEIEISFGGETSAETESVAEIAPVRHELINPIWIEDERLGTGKVAFLEDKETRFFQDLIERYLKPLIKDKEQEEQNEKELMDLKNGISIAFLFFNGVFIIATFFLQLNVKSVYIYWPCPNKAEPGSTYSGVDPLGFIFLILFGSVILIQTIAMLVHRLGTFLHIMSTTIIYEKSSTEAQTVAGMVELARKLGNLDVNAWKNTNSKRSSMLSDADDTTEDNHREKTVLKIDKDLKATMKNTTISAAFQRRWRELEPKLMDDNDNLDQLTPSAFAPLTKQKSTRNALQSLRYKMSTRWMTPPNGNTINANMGTDSKGRHRKNKRPPLVPMGGVSSFYQFSGSTPPNGNSIHDSNGTIVSRTDSGFPSKDRPRRYAPRRPPLVQPMGGFNPFGGSDTRFPF